MVVDALGFEFSRGLLGVSSLGPLLRGVLASVAAGLDVGRRPSSEVSHTGHDLIAGAPFADMGDRHVTSRMPVRSLGFFYVFSFTGRACK